MYAASRLVAFVVFAGTLVTLFPGLARAGDASDDAALVSDAATPADDAALVSDAGGHADDAATGASTHCTPSGNPCTPSEQCCPGTYCGAFNASSGAPACGADMPDVVSTGSCSVGSTPGVGGVALLALVGTACRLGLRRKRRHRPT